MFDVVTIDRLVPQIVAQGNPTFGGLPLVAAYSRKSAHAKTIARQNVSEADKEYPEIGARLKRLREAFSDLDQTQWSAREGFTFTRWNNWETGVRRIPVECAEALAERYGLTLDWIYRGRRDGLSDRASKVL